MSNRAPSTGSPLRQPVPPQMKRLAHPDLEGLAVGGICEPLVVDERDEALGENSRVAARAVEARLQPFFSSSALPCTIFATWSARFVRTPAASSIVASWRSGASFLLG